MSISNGAPSLGQYLMVKQAVTNPGIALLRADDGTPVAMPWISTNATGAQALQVGDQVWIGNGPQIARYQIDFTTTPPSATAIAPISPLPFNSSVGSMELYNGRIYVIGGQTPGVLVCNASGVLLDQFEENNTYLRPGTDLLAFRGTLLVTDIPNDAIRRFSLAGNFLGMFHDSNGESGFDNPTQIHRQGSTFNILVGATDFPSGLYILNGAGEQIGMHAMNGFGGFHELPDGDFLITRITGLSRFDIQTNTFHDLVPTSSGTFLAGKIEPLNTFASGCGNGLIEFGEECDDGNLFSNDGCDSDCDTGPLCANGILEPGELCDDGNFVDNDGCDQDCVTTVIVPICANGILEPGEPCDDGNTLNGDGCSDVCEVEAVCGNNVVELGEQCDDGNLVSGDGCDSQCDFEPVCGNGRIDIGEECDGPPGCDPNCEQVVQEPVFCETTETSAHYVPPGTEGDFSFGFGIRFGSDIQLDGDRLFIGGPHVDDGLIDSPGAIFYYKLVGGAWVLTQILHQPENAEFGTLGDRMDLEGDLLAAVCRTCYHHYDEVVHHVASKVLVWHFDGSWILEAELYPDDIDTHDQPNGIWLNDRPALSGNTLLLAYPDYTPGGLNGIGTNPPVSFGGGAWIYTRDEFGAWTQQQRLLAPDMVNFGHFGSTADLDGDVAVLGAEDMDALYVFRRVGGVWEHEVKITPPVPDELFADSISLSGDTVAVRGTDVVYLYRHLGHDWAVEQVLSAPVAGSHFGYAIDLEGDLLVIGAPGESTSADSDGAAFVYQRSGSRWTLLGRLLASDAAAGDVLGSAVVVSGRRVAVGAPLHDTFTNERDEGAAYLYDLMFNDCDADGVEDRCETDCNANGMPDDCDIAGGQSTDCQPDGIPDECQLGETEVQTIVDGGFETGTPNAHWSEASTNFGTPICSNALCGNGNGSFLPRTGTYFAWFGGVGEFEAASLEQLVQIPPGQASLKFHVRIASSSDNPDDFLRVLMDGNEIFFVHNSELENYYLTYVPVTVDVSQWADGGSHLIRIESIVMGMPFGSSFLVDDMSLTAHTIPMNDDDDDGIPNECDSAGCPTVPGDANSDFSLDGRDVSKCVSCFLAGSPLDDACMCLDFDTSGTLTESDLLEFADVLIGN